MARADEQPSYAYPHWAERRRKALESVNKLYDQGMRALREHARDQAGSAFFTIEHYLTYDGGGDLLFEQLDDGTWAYRCDEITKLFALAAFRLAVVHEEDPDHFCLALQSRPDLILALVEKESLSPKTRATFDKMKHDGHPILGQCYYEHGWRQAGPKPPSWGLGGGCSLDQPGCPR